MDEDARGWMRSRPLILAWPVDRPRDWTDRVNATLSAGSSRLRVSVERGRPYGQDLWVKRTIAELG